MSIKCGDLRIPITLKEPHEGTPDLSGRPVTTWSDYATVYAAMKDVSGREFYEAASFHMEDTVTFTIRYDDGVTHKMRVLCRGVLYEILEINHLGYRGDYMKLQCRVVEPEA